MKATISNKFVEVTQQSYIPFVNKNSSRGRKSYSNHNSENYQANVNKSINRARKQIRRLLECNFTDEYAFVTLTFSPSEEININDIKKCNKMFADFKKRLSYFLKKNKQPDFKYLGVMEFQDKNRQGAIHYHLVCNIVDMPIETLQRLWSYGWVYKSNTRSDATVNEKISYYLKKGITDPRLNGSKRYFHSHGLNQPITLEVENPDEFYNNLDQCNPTLLEGRTFHTPFSGETKYENYYVENAKGLIEYVQEP